MSRPFTFICYEDLKQAVDLWLREQQIALSMYGPISDWDVSYIEDMHELFDRATRFNGDLSRWDVSRVRDMTSMFRDATNFDGDLSSWDVSNVERTAFMFCNAKSFRGRGLGHWDVSNVTTMSRMFAGATALRDCDLSQWNVSSVEDMDLIFAGAAEFRGDLSKWDVSSVRLLNYAFWHATRFDCDLSQWNVSRVEEARRMFDHSSFTGDVSTWRAIRLLGTNDMEPLRERIGACRRAKLAGVLWTGVCLVRAVKRIQRIVRTRCALIAQYKRFEPRSTHDDASLHALSTFELTAMVEGNPKSPSWDTLSCCSCA